MTALTCKAVLFDLDGTLLDTLEDLANSCNHALRELGLPTHPVKAYRRFVGNGARVLIERILPREALDDETIAKARALFDEHYHLHQFDRTQPYPGIPELLRALKENGLLLGVVSNKPDEFVQLIAAHYFPGVLDAVAGQQGKLTKPDPTGVNKVMSTLGVTPEETLYVGDSGVDIETAHNAHTLDCGVNWGFRGAEELTRFGASHLADRPEDILKLLGI